MQPIILPKNMRNDIWWLTFWWTLLSSIIKLLIGLSCCPQGRLLNYCKIRQFRCKVFTAEVLFSGPPAHVHPKGVHRRVLLPFICTMCNVSLQHGLLHESQKEAIVTPILKKHDLDPDDVKSYRPISNLTFISKVIERIVASQLTGYLQRNKLLPYHQSAYRQGHYTETALLKIFSDILDAADSAQVTLLGPECSLRHCIPRHPPDKATKVVRCR